MYMYVCAYVRTIIIYTCTYILYVCMCLCAYGYYIYIYIYIMYNKKITYIPMFSCLDIGGFSYLAPHVMFECMAVLSFSTALLFCRDCCIVIFVDNKFFTLFISPVILFCNIN